MKGHTDIQLMLYEYLRNELTSQDRATIAEHLSTCGECAKELESLRETIALLPAPSTTPSEERTDEFWNAFAGSIAAKVTKAKQSPKNPLVEILDWVEDALLLRPRFVYAVAGSCTVLVVALAFWTFWPDTKREARPSRDEAGLIDVGSQPVESVGDAQSIDRAQRMRQYLRKSKTLFVGLANMKTGVAEPLDFSSERRLSRDLIHEARYLRGQPLDARSRRLMRDMERILVELENIEGDNDLPDVEIVRSGIHQENLIFKIRMAEAMFDTSRFLTVGEDR